MTVLLVIVAIVLVCVVFVNVQACRFYLSAYARATKHGFLETMRNAHAREVYAVSRRLAPHAGKAKSGSEGVRIFFDVAIPRSDATVVMADAVLVSPDGIAVVCVQEGYGKLYGSVIDSHWLLVGLRSGDNAERLAHNLGVQTAQAVLALREYLLLEEGHPHIVAAVVLGCFVKSADVEVPSGVLLTGIKNTAKAISGALTVDGTEESANKTPAEATDATTDSVDSESAKESKNPENVQDSSDAQASSSSASHDGLKAENQALIWDAATRKRICHMIKICANAGIHEDNASETFGSISRGEVHAASASGSVPSDMPHESKPDTTYKPHSFSDESTPDASGKDEPSGGILRSIVQRGRKESGVAEIVRKADRLAASKEDFDALTWNRILEIGAELEQGTQSDRTAELAAELRLIARTNISLNYRFGIAQPSAESELSPAGLVVESNVKTLDPTPPDPAIHEAIEQSTFFDDNDEDDTGNDETAERNKA